MVPVFCDQVVTMLVVESDTGKRNLEIPLDIVRKKVYRKILHCWLRRISINALTHVLRKNKVGSILDQSQVSLCEVNVHL